MCRAPGAICALALLLTALSPSVLAADVTDGIDAAIERVIRWLPTAECEPFTNGVSSFRTYMIDVECWHRLSVLDTDPSKREGFGREAIRRLRKGMDAAKLEATLRSPGGRDAFTEMILLASRCREHGVDPQPVRQSLALQREALDGEISRMPIPIKAIYAAYLPAVGVVPPVSLDMCRKTGMLANRPPEVDMTLAEIYYLTHEIFAYSDYGMRALPGLTEGEDLYLLRVLPFLTIFCFSLGQVDVAAELLGCLQAGAMRDTYGYREGLRILLASQNPDGSFGTADSTHAGNPSAFLHCTMNALTVLLRERALAHDES